MAINKYTTTEINGVITQIVNETNRNVGFIKVFFPDETESGKLTKKQTQTWIKSNNKRMKAICKFLNQNEL